MIKFILFLPLILILIFPVLLAIIGGIGFALWRGLTFETRFRRYFAKYDHNEELARMIAGGKIWTGQSAEELRDAKGTPLQVEQVQDNEIWVYKGNALTKQTLRIVVKDGRVVSWN